MTNHNERYQNGALWKTRRSLDATYLSDSNALRKVTIPRGEIVLLLCYQMPHGYQEDIAFLWNDKIYFAFEVDTGSTFDLDPQNINTKIKLYNL